VVFSDTIAAEQSHLNPPSL